MKIIGTGKNKTVIIEITESEADMITGVAGKAHIAGRYKPGKSVNIASVYEKVKSINEKHAELKAAVLAIKSSADDIDNSLILGE